MLKLFEPASPNPPAPIAPWDHFAAEDTLLVVKGAPEVLLPCCKFTLDPKGGEPIPLSPSVLERLTRVQEQLARDGQRVLLLARRVVRADEIPKDADPLSEEFGELVETLRDNLILVGLVGLVDPLKPDIPGVVSTCRRAGIRFFIVTGVSILSHLELLLSPMGSAGIRCRRSSYDIDSHRRKGWNHFQREQHPSLRGPACRTRRLKAKLNREGGCRRHCWTPGHRPHRSRTRPARRRPGRAALPVRGDRLRAHDPGTEAEDRERVQAARVHRGHDRRWGK